MRSGTLVIANLLALLSSGCGDSAQGGNKTEAASPPSPPKVQRGEGQAYEILGSEVWDVPDPVSQRTYQVFVNLPASYGEDPARRYPVLYVTDADYAFPVVRQIGRRLNVEGPKIEDFILIGLSYAKGEDGVQSRRRDYTPTAKIPEGVPANSVHGQSVAYQAYLRDQVKPFVAARYRVDPQRSLFLGHSYGGLLGLQILLTDPAMFNGYILGSPSIWFDRPHMRGLEADYAARHRDLPANVYFYVGEYESVRPTDPRFNRKGDLVADNRAFETLLKSRNYPSLRLRSEVLNDEDHVSVAPRGFTHGLKYLLPAK